MNETPLSGNETILFVDDEAPIRQLGQAILTHHGYNVILARDGNEAIEVFTNSKSGIDLVVLDLTMPLQSGWDVLKTLISMDAGVKVIISSGNHDTRRLDEFKKSAGNLEFVAKPYHPHDLTRTIRDLLDRKKSKD